MWYTDRKITEEIFIIMKDKTEYQACTLCPRECKVNRREGQKGYCGMDSRLFAARAALHMWEEPCISGEKGSGAVFFSGCSLRCCFCQNREIALGTWGKELTEAHLAEIFLKLEEQGAANINLVTATHYLPHVIESLKLAKGQGLSVPVVYNTSGYEKADMIRRLEGYVDIYLPDFKYMEPELAKACSRAPDYPKYAMEALKEMVRQTGACVFDENGYLKRGTVVRHLILPGHTRNSIKVLEYLYKTYGDDIYISIMNQFTPIYQQEERKELNRKVTRREYQKVLDKALEMGIQNGFFQEGETAKESFIPSFDGEGI